MIPQPKAQSQAVKHGNRRHAASIARQRKQTLNPSLEMAQAMHRWIKNAMRGGARLPEEHHLNSLPDDSWVELVVLLSDEEMALVEVGMSLESRLHRQVNVTWLEAREW